MLAARLEHQLHVRGDDTFTGLLEHVAEQLVERLEHQLQRSGRWHVRGDGVFVGQLEHVGGGLDGRLEPPAARSGR